MTLQYKSLGQGIPRGPDTVVLAEIRWHDGWFVEGDLKKQYLPDDSPWWKRGPGGAKLPSSTTGKLPTFFLDAGNACMQKRVVLQCQAAIRAGFDGCMFDWWPSQDAGQLALLHRVRQAVGDALILVNANDRVPKDMSEINGVFTEGFGAWFWRDDSGAHFSAPDAGKNGAPAPYPPPKGWQYLIKDLKRLEAQAKPPTINAVEAWGPVDDARYMRALTTLVLVYSNAYVLYSRSNQDPVGYDHSHVWDDFWTPDLGSPRDAKPPDPPLNVPGGAVYRIFSNGVAVYNPTSAAVAVPPAILEGLHRSHRLGGWLAAGAPVQVPPGDGDIFVK